MLFNFNEANLENIVIHHIGNKSNEEGIKLSKSPLQIQDEIIREVLQKYFLTHFKSDLFYYFHHDSDVSMNEIWNYATQIFENPDSFYDQSTFIAKHLYENSEHPKIKTGELYVVYFHDCVVEDELADVVGIFKSENKDTYLKVYQQNENFEVNCDKGININKLDKGCLIFNTEKEVGYKVSIVDNLNKSNEAQYWRDDFLNLKPRENDFYHTQNVMNMCKGFVQNVYNDTNNVEKTDQIDMLNKTSEYFKKKENFNINEFEDEIMGEQADVREAFNEYKQNYQQEKELKVTDDFEISKSAVKSNQKMFKSVLKLDKNFHVYIHGDREKILKGYDEERNLNFYQLFFENEESK